MSMNGSQRPDKRFFPRRPATPVKVRLAVKDTSEQHPGQILDYSPSGLSILADREYPADTVLAVWVVGKASETPELEVRVKNCRRDQKKWRLGCEFTHKQHWDDLHVLG